MIQKKLHRISGLDAEGEEEYEEIGYVEVDEEKETYSIFMYEPEPTLLFCAPLDMLAHQLMLVEPELMQFSTIRGYEKRIQELEIELRYSSRHT